MGSAVLSMRKRSGWRGAQRARAPVCDARGMVLEQQTKDSWTLAGFSDGESGGQLEKSGSGEKLVAEALGFPVRVLERGMEDGMVLEVGQVG